MPQPGQFVCRCYYRVAVAATVSAIAFIVAVAVEVAVEVAVDVSLAVAVAFLVCHPRTGSASAVAVVCFTVVILSEAKNPCISRGAKDPSTF
jgi:hypothetical protein